MKTNKPELIYSDPVKEIMGNPPRRILRWGTSVLFGVFVLFLIFAWLIRYPDTVPAPVEITTVNPPVTLVSKITGRIIKKYIDEKDTVAPGKLLVVMETAASIEEVTKLKQIVDTIKRPEFLSTELLPDFSELGELQVYWASFRKKLSDFNNYVTNDLYGSQITSTSKEIDEILVYIGRVKDKEKLYAENQRLEVKKYARDSSLFASGVFSESELEKSRQTLIRINIELQDVRLDHSLKSIELAQKNQLLQEFRIKRVVDMEKFYSELNELLLNLKAQMKIWENTYTLVSQIAGIVTFTKIMSENQSVTKDEPVLSIVPLETGDFVGRINLKMQRSGKVDTGQTVNIKLSGYPYLEYGMVRGVVKSKSLVPASDAYVIEIYFPNGLTTLYGKKLDFTQNMQGTAEIITEDLRLLQKIVNPFRHLISKNKR
ncbi:MAG: HlyD family secretion protein [Bacteroidales bacterium]|nr:HlyD family secretion protein [Bacteroidales bacterium]